MRSNSAVSGVDVRSASPLETDSLIDSHDDGELSVDSDEVLLGRILDEQCSDAFTELVTRHASTVMGVALRYVRDRHRAEDVFQATFLILAEKAEKIRNRKSLGSWLHGVARRLALRTMSQQRKQPVQGLPVEPAVDVPQLDTLEKAFDQQEIDEAIHSLPETLREPIVLFYLEQLTAKDVADRLNLTVETVEGRLRRGREQLRRRLMKQGITLAAVVATCQTAGVAAESAATQQLIQNTASAGLAWTMQTPLTGCTPHATHLAGKELAAMTTAKISTMLALTAAICLTTGFTVAFAQFGGEGFGGRGRPERRTRVPGDGIRTGVAEKNRNDQEGGGGIAVESAGATGEEGDDSGVITGIEFVPDEASGTFDPATGSGEFGFDSSGGAGAVFRGGGRGAGRMGPKGPQEPVDYLTHSPRRMKMENALDQEISAEFVDTPLRDFLDYVSQSLDVPILIDEQALSDEGIDGDFPITLNVAKLPARDILELVLDTTDLQLDYIMRNGVLQVTTQLAASEHYETVTYELRPLVPLTPIDVQTVLEETTDSMWLNIDGDGGTSVAIPGGLVVRQTQRGHREVVEVLNQLARFVNRADLGDPQPLPEPKSYPGGFGGGGFGGMIGGGGETESGEEGGLGGGSGGMGGGGGFF